MKHIDISTPKHPNTFTIVDDGDYEAISEYKWFAHEWNGYIYAERANYGGKPVKLHRQIMGFPPVSVDHKNRVTLDNRRCNLRRATKSQNTQNSDLRKDSFSGLKGVGWDKAAKNWRVRIKKDGKAIYLGNYFCLVSAAKAYDKKASELFGEFANINFPAAICKIGAKK